MIRDLSLLETFVALATDLSFSKVATRFNSSQSAISKKIVLLETSLQKTLFVRSTRKVKLSEDGAALLPLAQKILEDSKHLFETSNKKLLDSQVTGTLRVSAPETYANARLVKIISAFKDKFPNIHVDLVLSNTFLDLNSDNIDLAIRIGNLVDSSLKSIFLEENYLVVCASAKMKKKIQSPISIEHLKAFSPMFLGMHADSKVKPQNKSLDKVLGKSSIEVNSGETINQLCIAGYGVAVRSLWDIERYVQEDKLHIVSTKESIISEKRVYAVFPNLSYTPKKVRIFLDFMKDFYKKNSKGFLS